MQFEILTPLLGQARQSDLDVNALKIEQRREWAGLAAVERLEHALSVARTRLAVASQRLSQVR